MGNVKFAIVGLALLVTAGCGSTTKPTSTATPSASSTSSSGATSTPSGVVESNPAGDIPDNQAFVTFRDPAGGFRVSVPEGWSQQTAAGATVFSDKYNEIRIQTRSVASAPTPDSVRTQELPAVAGSVSGFAAGSVTTMNRPAGSAVLATYRANSATNPVTGKYAVEAVERYAFFRAGREVIVTLAAPVGSDNVDPWRKITDSFAWGAS